VRSSDESAADDALPGLSAAWEERAGEWAAWARTPDTDVYFTELNWPAFKALLPVPGRRTVDIGCGEGRVGRELAAGGHRVAGVDSSATLVALAREAGGYDELACADAGILPWPAGAFDLAVAFMSLHDMDDPIPAIGEVARVLQPGGLFCVATVHPFNRPLESVEDYFSEHRVATTTERNGIQMTFETIDRPFDTYTRALARAGFVIEELREPRPRAADVDPRLAKARAMPFFIHMRCRLDRAL
jgi:SAM-dependent methyltransferase